MTTCRSCVVAAAGLVALAGDACGQLCGPWWRVRFEPRDALYGSGLGPYSPGRVSESVVFDDDGGGPRPAGLYVTGLFSRMGDVAATGVARWDGKTWTRLGLGLVGASGSGAMAVYGAGGGAGGGAEELYVVSDAIGVNSLGVAKWNGVQWRAAASNTLHYVSLGDERGFPSKLWTLDPDGAGPEGLTLYAAQTSIAGYQISGGTWGHVWQLENGAWVRSAFSPPSAIGRVDDMVVFDEDGTGPAAPTLYLTRYRDWYTNLPSEPTTFGSEARLSKVVGSALVNLATTDLGSYSSLAVLDADGPGPQAAKLYVAGDFRLAGAGDHVHLARLDGSALTPIGNDDGTQLLQARVLDDDGGGPALPALYVTGNFNHIGGIAARGVAWFDGTTWSALGPGIGSSGLSSGAVRTLTVFDDDGPGPRRPFVYAGGEFLMVGYAAARGIAHWDGAFWQPPGALLNNAVRTLLAADVGQGPSLYVGGSFTSADGLQAVGIARWDGQEFSRLSAGMNNRVDALAAYGGQLVAAGKFTLAGGAAANHVARWTGSAWQALGAGVDGDVNALAVDGAALYAAGSFLNAGGAAALRTAKWNGTQWSALGAGLNGDVRALAVHGGSLYAGGDFTASGTTLVNHVARWSGTAWVAAGAGIAGPVSHLVSFRGKLYAGSVCGSAACISAWDGAAWAGIPGLTKEGAAATLTGLGAVDEDGAGPGLAFLYASGEFDRAGTVAAQRLARWDGALWTAGSFGGAALDAPARAFAGFGNPPVVYVGGEFRSVGANGGAASWFLAGYDDCPTPCYANCDESTIAPVLNINDFVCFQQRFGAGYPDANCDGSTIIPVLNVNDFVCFMGRYAAGCP